MMSPNFLRHVLLKQKLPHASPLTLLTLFPTLPKSLSAVSNSAGLPV